MEKKIDELKRKHREGIACGLRELLEERDIQYMDEYSEDLALVLEEVNSVSDTGEYESYIKMLDEIERQNPRLAARLEEYFLKELNLVALLGFQMGSRVGSNKSIREEEKKLV